MKNIKKPNLKGLNIIVYDSGKEEKETRYLVKIFDNLFCISDTPKKFSNYCGKIQEYPEDLFDEYKPLTKVPRKLEEEIKYWTHEVFFNKL